MLPPLAAVFFLGLLCGAQFSFYPLSVIVLLAGIAVGFSLLERVGHIDSRSALLLYSSLLSGSRLLESCHADVGASPRCHHHFMRLFTPRSSVGLLLPFNTV